jgi:hypothetical protein
MPHRPDPDDTPTPWYFAYGANMSPRVLRRRGITPEESRAARLEGYAFRFSQRGLILLEPGFANIEPEPGEEMWGVAHRLPPGQLARLDGFEGPGYGRVLVDLETDEGPVQAQAYINPRPTRGLEPSRRYARLCVGGARAFGLPEDYVTALAAHPTRHVPLVSEFLMLLVWLVERSRSIAGGVSERVRRVLKGTLWSCVCLLFVGCHTAGGGDVAVRTPAELDAYLSRPLTPPTLRPVAEADRCPTIFEAWATLEEARAASAPLPPRPHLTFLIAPEGLDGFDADATWMLHHPIGAEAREPAPVWAISCGPRGGQGGGLRWRSGGFERVCFGGARRGVGVRSHDEGWFWDVYRLILEDRVRLTSCGPRRCTVYRPRVESVGNPERAARGEGSWGAAWDRPRGLVVEGDVERTCERPSYR